MGEGRWGLLRLCRKYRCCLLDDGAGVEDPHQVVCDVNTKELGALDDLLRGPIDAQWRVIMTWPPEVRHCQTDAALKNKHV